jgi:outer membrane protein
LLNFDPNYDIFVDESEMEVKRTEPNFNSLLDIALKNRNDLKIKLDEKNILKKEISILYKEKLPTVTAGADVSETNQEDHTTKKTTTAKDMSVSLKVSVPIFSGFNNNARIAKTKNNLKKLDAEIEELKNQIFREVWVAYNNLVTAEQTFSIAQNTLDSEAAHARLMFGMYKNGKCSILEVLEANNNLQSAKFQLIASRYDWLNGRISLLKTIGRMTIENVNNMEEF